MKGIMVPLLMLGMTGIVVGQHADSNVFQSTAYQANSANNGPANNGPGKFSFAPQVDQNDVKPMNLSVDEQQIAGIKGGLVLDSRIDPRSPDGNPLPLQVVSGVTLMHKNNQAANPLTRTLFGTNEGGGKLSVELDDLTLVELQTKKLVIEIPEGERGKYNVVAFNYKPPTTGGIPGANPRISMNPIGPSPDDSFGSSRVPFGPPNRNDVGQLLLPGPEAFPGSSKFVGPVRSPETNNDNRPNAWGPLARPSTNPNLTDQRFSGDPTSVWNKNPNNQPAESPAQYNQRMLQAKLESDALRRRQMDASPTFRPSGDQLPRTTTPGNFSVDQPLTNQQIADRRAILEKQRQLDDHETDLKAWEAALARQKRELENERFMNSLKVNRDENIMPRVPTGPVAGQSPQTGAPGSSPPDRWASLNADDVVNSPLRPSHLNRQRNVSDQTPTPTSSIKNWDARVPGVIASTGDATNPANPAGGRNPASNRSAAQAQLEERKVKRTEGFIYFMLLCSLGLNVYLGLISRGFYVRYNELADELRETFTATM